MGESNSKSTSDVFMENVNNVMVSSMQKCSQTSAISQIINIKGDGNVLSDIEMNQVFTSLLTCVQDVNVIAKLQSDLSAEIKSQSEAQNVALIGLLGKSDSEVNSRIYSSVRNAVNVQAITEMINNVKSDQMINIEGQGNTLVHVSMKQINNSIASSSQQVIANIDVLATIKNKLDQSSKATQTDPITDFFNGLSKLFTGPLMWVAIIIIGGLIVFVIFLNTGAGATVMNTVQEQYQDETEEYPIEQQQIIPQPSAPIEYEPLPIAPIRDQDQGIVQNINSLTQAPKFNLPKLDENRPIPLPPMNSIIINQSDEQTGEKMDNQIKEYMNEQIGEKNNERPTLPTLN